MFLIENKKLDYRQKLAGESTWLGLSRPNLNRQFPGKLWVETHLALAYQPSAFAGPASPPGGPASGRAQNEAN